MNKAKHMHRLAAPPKMSLYLSLIFCAFLYLRVYGAAVNKPNIIILFADDLGYGDLQIYGHPTSSTPNLNSMASEGLVLTQFYSANPVCSPSRAALMTGRYPPRTGIWPRVLNPNSIGGLPHNETTIAEALKTAGYKTGMVGKWHLGVGENGTYLPTNHGFDYYLGIPYSNDECPCTICYYPNSPCNSPLKIPCNPSFVSCPVFENTDIIEQPAHLPTLSTKYSNAALGFIRANAGKNPFFLYMAFTHVHQPQFSGEHYTNTTLRGPFGDALAELDNEVGLIMSTLKDTQVDDNTFVFFTSDNGPSLRVQQQGGNGGLLRCGKGSTWDGGMREPAIAWWPEKIRQGKTAELAATIDLFPTIMSITGAKPGPAFIDGVDMSPILFDSKPSNRESYVYFPAIYDPSIGYHAIRWKQYKAHYYTSGGIGLCPNTYPDIVCRGNYSRRSHDPPLLYNLHQDPGEIYNLDTTRYADVMANIDATRNNFESTFEYSESQVERGTNANFMPCASPGCSPFPSCCKTSSQESTLWTSYSSTRV